jgi:hypothetical protein
MAFVRSLEPPAVLPAITLVVTECVAKPKYVTPGAFRKSRHARFDQVCKKTILVAGKPSPTQCSDFFILAIDGAMPDFWRPLLL